MRSRRSIVAVRPSGFTSSSVTSRVSPGFRHSWTNTRRASRAWPGASSKATEEPTQSLIRRPVYDSNPCAAHTSRPHASVLNTTSGEPSRTSRSPMLGANEGGPWRWDRTRSDMTPHLGFRERHRGPPSVSPGHPRDEVSTSGRGGLSVAAAGARRPAAWAGAGRARSPTLRAPMTPSSPDAPAIDTGAGARTGALGLREVFATWAPLAGSWVLMGLELPLASAAMARMPQATVSLAAYGGVVFPLALLIESPILMLLTASTALARDRRSYGVVRRFMLTSAGLLTVLHALLAFTPLFDLVAGHLIGVPEPVREPARLGL